MPVNTYDSEFGARIGPDNALLFTSMRGSYNKEGEVEDTMEYRSRLYMSSALNGQWTEAVALKGQPTNGQLANSTWSGTGKWIFTTHCHGDSPCRIHYAPYDGRNVDVLTPLEGLGDALSTQPMVVHWQGRELLFFVSDRTGGPGGMDIWQAGSTNPRGDGWIGRFFDNTCNGTPIPEGAVSIGRTAPLAMVGKVQKPINFESPDLFRWMGGDVDAGMDGAYQALNRAGVLPETAPRSQAAFLMRTALDAQVSSDRIRAAVERTPLTTWPGSDLARQLRMVSAMIRDGMKTRVYYASIAGFDTHAGQLGTHARNLQQVGDALLAFQNELKAQGNQDRVLTLVFSEFGRRVAQNASGGTDHGTAAPSFLIGSAVRPGVHGQHPSLRDLDNGDLKFTQDFRGVYGAVLEDWLKAPSGKVLGGTYPKPKVIRA